MKWQSEWRQFLLEEEASWQTTQKSRNSLSAVAFDLNKPPLSGAKVVPIRNSVFSRIQFPSSSELAAVASWLSSALNFLKILDLTSS